MVTQEYTEALHAMVRKLRKQNAELPEACKAGYEAMILRYDAGVNGDFWNEATALMREAIAKVEGDDWWG